MIAQHPSYLVMKHGNYGWFEHGTSRVIDNSQQSLTPVNILWLGYWYKKLNVFTHNLIWSSTTAYAITYIHGWSISDLFLPGFRIWIKTGKTTSLCFSSSSQQLMLMHESIYFFRVPTLQSVSFLLNHRLFCLRWLHLFLHLKYPSHGENTL